jgi:hypothetical protein
MTNLAEHDPRVVEARSLGAVGVIIKADNGINKLVDQVREAIAGRPPDPLANRPT